MGKVINLTHNTPVKFVNQPLVAVVEIEELLEPFTKCEISLKKIIGGSNSGLNRPEGITFLDDVIVVANSENNTVTFYEEINGEYQDSPSFVLSNGINYPHDLDYNDNYLAVVNSAIHTVTVYRRNGKFVDSTPVATISGLDSQLHWPRAIKYNKDEIVVANLYKNTLTFYRHNGDVYENKPYRVINVPGKGYAGTDGLAFSKNGVLAVTVHDDKHVAIFSDMVNKPSILYSSSFNCPHSVAYYNDDLFITDGGKRSIKVLSNGTLKEITLSHELKAITDNKEENGIKGIAFSKDYTKMALCESQEGNPHLQVSVYSITQREVLS